jgi:hypothetical protein
MRPAKTVLASVGLCALLLPGCGGDDEGGGDSTADPELVELLQSEAGQTEAIATCIAESLEGDDTVDRQELESIIGGEGSTDIDTAEAYGGAALECAREALGDLGDIPGVPDDLTDQLTVPG